MRLWSGDIHSHPSHSGYPSNKSGQGLGDIGYVEAIFSMNKWMQHFLMPIITRESDGLVLIHPWVCERADPVRLLMADLRVVEGADFPRRIFNPEWEEGISHIDVVA